MEAAGDDVASCITDEGDYTQQVISSVDEIPLGRKKMPARTLTLQEVSAWLAASEDRLTFLLGPNVDGDLCVEACGYSSIKNPGMLWN